jgi:hypothetical protein
MPGKSFTLAGRLLPETDRTGRFADAGMPEKTLPRKGLFQIGFAQEVSRNGVYF